MKHLKTYKIFETGEWSRDIDWQFVKDNPDNDSEESNYIKQMEKDLNNIKEQIDDEGEINFEIIDIKGFDLYQGPCATIKINDDKYNVWPNDEGTLWVEDFPIDNCSEQGLNPGFDGYEDDIAKAIIDYYKPINKEIRKYNL